MSNPPVSRGGIKLEHAINTFNLDSYIRGKICADFGSSTGGFVDILLEHGALKVYAIEKGFGILDWKLRNNPKVVVMERTNALYAILPEAVDVVTIDTSWTKQEKIIEKALENLKSDGIIISLIKPHYEAPKGWLKKGKLSDENAKKTLELVKKSLVDKYVDKMWISGVVESPIKGEKGGNTEYLMIIHKLARTRTG